MARKFGIFISENTRDRGDDSRVEISGDRDGKDNRSGPSMAFYHRQHCPSLDPDSLLFALKSLFPSCTLRFSYFTLRNVSDLSLSLSLAPSASFNAFTDVLYHLVEKRIVLHFHFPFPRRFALLA